MPTAKPPAAAGRTYIPERFYGVDLVRITSLKGRPLSPAHGLELRGDACALVDADIGEARLLPEIPGDAG